jgi:hypothetical protein
MMATHHHLIDPSLCVRALWLVEVRHRHRHQPEMLFADMIGRHVRMSNGGGTFGAIVADIQLSSLLLANVGDVGDMGQNDAILMRGSQECL